MTSPLKARLQEDVKQAMKARERERLAATRMIMAAIKQREVDERIELDDEQVIEVLTRMIKQRRDSLGQYEAAGRQDLADKEAYEIVLISEYRPPALDDATLDGLIDEAVAQTGAASPRDIGKVMGALGPRVKGRADMGEVSRRVKARLS